MAGEIELLPERALDGLIGYDATGLAGRQSRTSLGIKRLYPSGRWINPEGMTVTSGGGVASGQNSEKAIPVFIREPITIAELGVRCTTAAASGNMQFAVYASDPATGMPTGTPLYAGTSKSVAPTGAVKDSGVALAVTPGLYWFAVNHDASANTAIHLAITGSGIAQWIGADNGAMINAFSLVGIARTQTFGTWPTHTGSFSGDGWADVTSGVPAMAFRPA